MSLFEYAKSKLWRSSECFAEKKQMEKPMFDKLFGSLKDELGLSHIASLLNAINQVSAHFNDEYVKDHDLRNASLDAISEVFQSLKKNPS